VGIVASETVSEGSMNLAKQDLRRFLDDLQVDLAYAALDVYA
jgi:hypothetical protein